MPYAKYLLGLMLALLAFPAGVFAASLISPTEPEETYPVTINATGVNVGSGNTVCLGVNADPWNTTTNHCDSGVPGTGNDDVSCEIAMTVGNTITAVYAYRHTNCTDTFQSETLATGISIAVVSSTAEESTSTTAIVDAIEGFQEDFIGLATILIITLGGMLGIMLISK